MRKRCKLKQVKISPSKTENLDEDSLLHNRLKENLHHLSGGIFLPRQKRRRTSILDRGNDITKYTSSEIKAIQKLDPNFFDVKTDNDIA